MPNLNHIPYAAPFFLRTYSRQYRCRYSNSIYFFQEVAHRKKIMDSGTITYFYAQRDVYTSDFPCCSLWWWWPGVRYLRVTIFFELVKPVHSGRYVERKRKVGRRIDRKRPSFLVSRIQSCHPTHIKAKVLSRTVGCSLSIIIPQNTSLLRESWTREIPVRRIRATLNNYASLSSRDRF